MPIDRRQARAVSQVDLVDAQHCGDRAVTGNRQDAIYEKRIRNRVCLRGQHNKNVYIAHCGAEEAVLSRSKFPDRTVPAQDGKLRQVTHERCKALSSKPSTGTALRQSTILRSDIIEAAECLFDPAAMGLCH